MCDIDLNQAKKKCRPEYLQQVVDLLKEGHSPGSKGDGSCKSQPHQESIDTTTINGELVFGIFASLAQFKRSLISERTKAGLKAARARGRKGGRPKSLSAKQVKTAQKMYDANSMTMAEIAETVGTTEPTLYRHIRVQLLNTGHV